jgi:hypothetical protein
VCLVQTLGSETDSRGVLSLGHVNRRVLRNPLGSRTTLRCGLAYTLQAGEQECIVETLGSGPIKR